MVAKHAETFTSHKVPQEVSFKVDVTRSNTTTNVKPPPKS
jgi:hypothetical protein